MNKRVLIVVAIIFGIFGIGSAAAQAFTLTSEDVKGQLTDTQVLAGFGCTGKNISPALHWIDAPKNTKSFAVTVYDPDAPTGSGWWHWVIVNLSAEIHGLPADAGNPHKDQAPKGSLQSVTDYGTPGFGGACPPAGDKPHRYIFTVYALDVAKLEMNEQSSPALVGFALHQHAIAKASLLAYYGRD